MACLVKESSFFPEQQAVLSEIAALLSSDDVETAAALVSRIGNVVRSLQRP